MGIGTPDDRSKNSPALVAWRLEQAEKKLQTLDDKLNELTGGFIGLKVELEHVAKNEGKTSGAISGVVTGFIVAVLSVVAQVIFKAD